jgi:hypothetical protein
VAFTVKCYNIGLRLLFYIANSARARHALQEVTINNQLKTGRSVGHKNNTWQALAGDWQLERLETLDWKKQSGSSLHSLLLNFIRRDQQSESESKSEKKLTTNHPSNQSQHSAQHLLEVQTGNRGDHNLKKLN